MAKNILTNDDARALVSRSIYLGEEPDFVVALVVGYSRKEDNVRSAKRAIEAFRELVTADDWQERTFQLWESRTGNVREYVPEENAK